METDKNNTKSLERVAQYLDGEKVTLSAEEQMIASEIDCDQRAMAKAMDQVDVPRVMIDRLRRRMTAQAAAPSHRVLKMASMAAAVLVAALLIWHAFSPATNNQNQIVASENTLEVVVTEVAPPEADKMDLMSAMTMSDDELNEAIQSSTPPWKLAMLTNDGK